MNDGNEKYSEIDLSSIAAEYGHMVSSVCSRMISNRDIAQEAAQETCIEITRSIRNFRGESKLSTWIYTITRRVIIRYLRNEKIHSTEYLREYFRSEDPPAYFPDPNTDYEENIKEMCQKCLTGMLHCLDKDARLAYVLRDMVKLSYKQISEIFGKNEAALRKNVSRSRRKLRSFLEDECYLINPNGKCQCRMKKYVADIQLHKEFAKLRGSVHQMRIFKDAAEILPQKDYWEKYL